MTISTVEHRPPIIAPSMLKCDFGNLDAEIERLDRAGTKWFHWDVMDGHFVPNLSYGALLIESIRTRTKSFFDAHLMIGDPARYLDDYIKAGCDAITFHIEAVPQPLELAETDRNSRWASGRSRGSNPHTPTCGD